MTFRTHTRLWLAFAALTLLACRTPPRISQASSNAPKLGIVLRPTAATVGAPVTALAVALELDAGPATLSLRVPIVYAGVSGIADHMDSLIARDGDGPLPLGSTDDPPAPGGYPYFRHYRSTRPTKYPIHVSYRARIKTPGGRPGPPWDLRPSGIGVSAAGSGFLLLPEEWPALTQVSLSWNLEALPMGATALASFGEGAVHLTTSPDELLQAWYMAGVVDRFPVQGDVGGFSAAWLGKPPWDAARDMAWTAEMFRYLRQFFGDQSPRRYRVFMRVVDEPPNRGGTALGNSFMLSMPPTAVDSSGRGPLTTLTHEMVHLWVGMLTGLPGESVAGTSWFHEGLTTYYSQLLPLRAGLVSVADYGRTVNETALSYYLSPARNVSSDSIGRVGFGAEETRRIPYARGALYWAHIDGRLRAKSLGKRNLDSVMLPLFRARARGEPLTAARWRHRVVEELGPTAGSEFDAVIGQGRTLIPDSGAFGPCLDRRTLKRATPRGEVEAYEWVRVDSIAEARCRLW